MKWDNEEQKETKRTEEKEKLGFVFFNLWFWEPLLFCVNTLFNGRTPARFGLQQLDAVPNYGS